MCLYVTHATRALQSHDLSGEGIKLWIIHTFLTIQGHGGPPRRSDQPNAGATSETAQTWKTIHTKHTLSHLNEANMELWWRSNDIRGSWGLKFPDIYLTDEEKPRQKPHPGNLSRTGNEPGPAAWQARMLPLAPQRWTITISKANYYWRYYVSPRNHSTLPWYLDLRS